MCDSFRGASDVRYIVAVVIGPELTLVLELELAFH